jgi:hypothetical protein
MAAGDLVVFDEAKAKMIEGDWASTDEFYCAICNNTATPAAASATPVIGDFTQVGAAGTYVTNGLTLGALSTLVTEAAGTMKFDSATNPTWAQDASNDVDAYWAIIYNFTNVGKDCLCFIDLGGPVNMSDGALTVTWNASGIFTIA